jgi:hypothetical protein
MKSGRIIKGRLLLKKGFSAKYDGYEGYDGYDGYDGFQLEPKISLLIKFC